jgi:Right handed beta helix region
MARVIFNTEATARASRACVWYERRMTASAPARCAALLILCWAVRAGAVEIYVGPAGSDGDDGSSPAHALRTIQRAADAAGPGDTVRIMAGTYVESVRVFNAGAPGSAIVFTPHGDGPVILDGERQGCPGGVKPRPDGHHYGFWVAGGHDVVIEGLEITRYCYEGVAFAGTSRATVRDCFVHHNGLDLPDGLSGQGIAAYGPAVDVVIERNVVTDNVPENDVSGSGIDANTLDRVTVRDNVSERNHGNGILVEDCTDALIEGNVARLNVGDFGTWGTAGLWLDGGHDVTVRGNWLEGNVWAGMEVSDETPADPYGYAIYDNVALGNRYGLWLDGVGRAGAAPNRVYNNTIVDSTASGIWLSRFAGFGPGAASPLTNTQLANNIAVQLAEAAPALAVDGAPFADVTLDHDLYSRAGSGTPIRWGGTDLTLADYQAASGWDGASTASDPRFVNAALADFHLRADSPAVDAGTAAFVPAADFDGKPRPLGAAVDLGAFEDGATDGDVVINWLETTPALIETGTQATLSWSTWQATQVTIDHGVGAVAAIGSRAVSPPATTTYTLTAEGGGGPVSAQATVTVVDPDPHCALPASPGGARLKLRRLDQSGRARLALKANLAVTTPVAALAPAAAGVRVVLGRGPVGQVADALDLAVPGGLKGGPGGCSPKDGWKVNGAATTFTYVNKSGAADPPTCSAGSASGVAKLQIKDKSAKSQGADLKITGKNGDWSLAEAGDLMATLLFDDGTCAWVRFEPTACTFGPGAVSCRR